MRDTKRILELWQQRQGSQAGAHAKMTEVANVYNGRTVVPLPDMDRTERPAIPNLLAQGVDQMSGRAVSTTPNCTFASKNPGNRLADRNAANASGTVTGWWQADKLAAKDRVRARRFIAYGSAPVVMRWDFAKHRPTWHVRHPLDTYPSPDLEPGQVQPTDCLFTYNRTCGWLADNGYGERVYRLIGDDKVGRDHQVRIIEYIDAEHTVLMAVGSYPGYNRPKGLSGVVLEEYENLSTLCPVVIPTRVTLDEVAGQFDIMLGFYYQQAKMMALEQIAVEKGVFPDTFLVSRPNELAKFIDGPYDGRTGKINIVAGGDIKDLSSSPGYMTPSVIDRLERASRVSAGIPSEFGGESGSNIRTGRRGDAVLSAVIDFPIAEMQGTLADARELEDEIAIQMAKKVKGDQTCTIYVGTGNKRKPTTYIPTKTFEVEEHVVSYPMAGADSNGLIIALGQRVGLGTMSKRTAQELDPFIADAEGEHDQIISEGLEQALMAGLQQQASQGQIPPLTLSRIMKLVSSDKMELAEALNKVTEEAMAAAQAQQGAPSTPEQLAAPGATAAIAGQPAVPPVESSMPGMDNLSGLLASLRRPTMAVQPMRGIENGAA